MSKFCSQCGAILENSDNICTSCGSPQGSKKRSKKAIGASTATAIVALMVIIFRTITIFSPGNYEKPLENMFKAAETGEGRYLCESCADFMVNSSSEIDTYYAKAKELNEQLENEFGDDISINYKYKDKKKLKEATIPRKYLGEFGGQMHLKSGYEVKLKVTVEGSKKKKSQTMKFEVIKYKNDWCIINMNDCLDEFSSII